MRRGGIIASNEDDATDLKVFITIEAGKPSNILPSSGWQHSVNTAWHRLWLPIMLCLTTPTSLLTSISSSVYQHTHKHTHFVCLIRPGQCKYRCLPIALGNRTIYKSWAYRPCRSLKAGRGCPWQNIIATHLHTTNNTFSQLFSVLFGELCNYMHS